eukprot:SAG31_NODE_8536_length_1434_cov_1.439700_2_plen_42_part_00
MVQAEACLGGGSGGLPAAVEVRLGDEVLHRLQDLLEQAPLN